MLAHRAAGLCSWSGAGVQGKGPAFVRCLCCSGWPSCGLLLAGLAGQHMLASPGFAAESVGIAAAGPGDCAQVVATVLAAY